MLGFEFDAGEYAVSYYRLMISGLLLVFLVLISKKLRLDLEKQVIHASIRGFVQIMIMASIILIIFELENLLIIAVVLIGMIVLASHVSGTRSEGLPDNRTISLISILMGSSIVIIVISTIGAIPLEAQYLIPLGGMVIGNSMNVTSLAMNRLRSEIVSNRTRIEAYLALGSTAELSVRESIHNSVKSSLIPNIDNLNTLGFIWIPGLMSGMLIAGSDPYVAAVLQLVIIFMILGASIISAIVSTYLTSRRLFTDAIQLVPLE